MQIIASGEPGLFKAVGFTCRFVRLPRRFAERGELSTDGVTAVDRLGLEVDVTTVERTIADPSIVMIWPEALRNFSTRWIW